MALDPANFWKGFDTPQFPKAFDFGSQENLAQKVLSSFGIPYDASLSIGGNLGGLDIKHMDAIQIIKLSLLQITAQTGVIYELYVNPKGEVAVKEIGTGVGPSDIYYEIQTSSYYDECSGVMITGRDPMAYRKTTSWRSALIGKEIHDCGFLYNSCADPSFNQYSVILYNDPQLDSSYNDGIDNLYNVTNPWETVTGYATYMDWEGSDSDSDTTVRLMDTAKVAVQVPASLGRLRRRPAAENSTWGQDPNCWDGPDSEDPDGGVEIPLPSSWRYSSVRGTRIDKFMGVVGVYVIGWPIYNMRGVPISEQAADNDDPAPADAKVRISIDETHPGIYKLDEGKHYVIAYASGPTPYIVFADNSRAGEVWNINGQPVDYEIDPHCSYAAKRQESGRGLTGNGLILPHEPMKGMLIEQIFAGIELETPSILVYNPEGSTNRAREIAESVVYRLKPIVTIDEPPPIAFNGGLLDQSAGVSDHDPTTTQNLSNTGPERAMELMNGGGGVTLSLSFLGGSECARLSGALKDFLDGRSGVETTYVCGPNCEAEVGVAGPNGGIVNSINYSYQDSNSYTISVNCGPVITGGFAQAGVGISYKATESYSSKGTIIQDQGDHVYFKVRVDGYGDVTAVNMVPTVLRVGDKVNVTIHNVPVEA